MAVKPNKSLCKDAPYWYNTSFKDLDFQWSKEEALEIERYCEKILKNVAEEDMTPLDRWQAHVFAKPNDFKNADRMLICPTPAHVYSARTLDGFADCVKPGDLYKNPKLLVKAAMVTVARYKLDWFDWAMHTYTEGLWGGRIQFVDYGNIAMVGEPPIKSMKDLEAVGMPDPYEDGVYPGVLWANREMRRIHDKYKLPLPIWSSMCPGGLEVAMSGMLGWVPFTVALKRNQELAKASSEKGNEWCKIFGRALIDVARPEGLRCCQFTGGFPLRGGNEWVADLWVDLGSDLKDYAKKKSKSYRLNLCHGYSYLTGILEWYDVLNKAGAMTDTMWDGGIGGRGEGPLDEAVKWHHEHNIFLSISAEDRIVEKGPIPVIEEEVTRLVNGYKYHRKFSPAIHAVYFMPPQYYDAAIATAKKVCKL